MLWNVQSLKPKLNDCDFINFVCDFDILLFTETWNSKYANLTIDGYESFDCPRPNFNSKAKRNSGGISVFFKVKYKNYIDLVSINEKGVIWFKLKKEFSCSQNDLYFCLSYIPPEGSSLYKNINSSLFEFDFFESLNNEIRLYNDLGDVYLLGDLNSRSGELPDFVSNINLDRYVNMPCNNEQVDPLLRCNYDKTVNTFGMKLLSLCKKCNIHIANGRCESGKCTFHSLYRHKPIASTVDS